jgi:hypothetical protein
VDHSKVFDVVFGSRLPVLLLAAFEGSAASDFIRSHQINQGKFIYLGSPRDETEREKKHVLRSFYTTVSGVDSTRGSKSTGV